jgi:hypothetical protein
MTTRLIPWPILLVLVALAAAAVVWLYRRDRALVPPGTAGLLLALRIALVTILLALLADPTRVRRETITEPGEVLVVVDASWSFSLADPRRPPSQKVREAQALGLLPGQEPAPEDPLVKSALEPIDAATRRDILARALAAGALEEASRRFRPAWFALAGGLEPLPPLRPGSLDEILAALPPATGATTNLGRPLLEEALRRDRGSLAGILLFTDGNHHAAGDPLDAARTLGALGVPIAAVGIGSLERPPGLSVDAIDATGKVFAGDEVKAQIAIAAFGLPAMDLPLTVSEGGKVVKEILLPIPPGGGVTRFPVEFPAGEPGRKKFTFSVPARDGDASEDDNFRDSWIEVLSGKARVTLLDGAPRWEERYLRSTWSRDPKVELRAFLVTPPPDRRLPSDFPRARDDLFASDVLILGDVDPALFTREEHQHLRDFVASRGGTMVLIAGERSMPYAWRDTPLAEALPVSLLEPAPPRDLGASIARDGLPLSLTPEGQASEITRLVPGRERNVELWGLLPRPAWLSPIAGLAPGAEPLVTAGAEAVSRLPGAPAPPSRASGAEKDAFIARVLRERGAVLVTRSFGAGRTLYAGIDSTWRWRFHFGDEIHGRFWGQVLRWAVSSRLGASDSHARLGTDALLYRAGAPVTVEALIETAPGKPFEEEPVDAVITRSADGAEGRFRMGLLPRSGGRYRGSASLDDLGIPSLPAGAPAGQPVEYRVRLEIPGLPGYSTREDRAAASFAFEPPLDLEARDLTVNRDLLEAMAAASGGRFFPLSRLREAFSVFPDRDRTREVVTEASPWSRPGILAPILLGLLAAEWVLRKRRDLV